MSTQPVQHTCPRCSAPIQVGQAECAVCKLPLDAASIQAFYAYQQQQARVQPAPVYQPLPARRRSPFATIFAVIVVGIIAVCVVGALLNSITKPSTTGVGGGSTATSRRASSESPITQSGNGLKKTSPFALQGGNYQIKWTATDTSGTGVGCYMGGALQAVQGSGYEMLANEVVKSTGTGITSVYNVKGGQYYLDMSSSCQWSVIISPQ